MELSPLKLSKALALEVEALRKQLDAACTDRDTALQKIEAIRCDYIAISGCLDALARQNQCFPEERQHTREQRDFLNRMMDYFQEQAEMLRRDGLPEIFQRVNTLEEENEKLREQLAEYA